MVRNNDIETEKRLCEMERELDRLKETRHKGLENLTDLEIRMVVDHRQARIDELERSIKETENKLIDSLIEKSKGAKTLSITDKNGWTHRFDGAYAKADGDKVTVVFVDQDIDSEFILSLSGGEVDFESYTIKLGKVLMTEFTTGYKMNGEWVDSNRTTVVTFENLDVDTEDCDGTEGFSCGLEYLMGVNDGISVGVGLEGVCTEDQGNDITLSDDIEEDYASVLIEKNNLGKSDRLRVVCVIMGNQEEGVFSEKNYVMYEPRTDKFIYVPGERVKDSGIAKIYLKRK